MILFDILLGLLIAVGVIIALVLLMPVHFRASGSIDEDDGARWRVHVAWAFGVLSLRLGSDGTRLGLFGVPLVRRPPGAEKRADEKKRVARPRKRRRRRRRGIAWLVDNRGFLLSVAGRYVRALHLSGGVEGVVGLADPDRTASLQQVLLVLDTMLPEGLVAIEIDWIDEQVALEGDLGGWVWPLQIVGITLRLILSRRTWRVLRAA